jgi:hypothetical protein
MRNPVRMCVAYSVRARRVHVEIIPLSLPLNLSLSADPHGSSIYTHLYIECFLCRIRPLWRPSLKRFACIAAPTAATVTWRSCRHACLPRAALRCIHGEFLRLLLSSSSSPTSRLTTTSRPLASTIPPPLRAREQARASERERERKETMYIQGNYVHTLHALSTRAVHAPTCARNIHWLLRARARARVHAGFLCLGFRVSGLVRGLHKERRGSTDADAEMKFL